jgi:hypothetical protein
VSVIVPAARRSNWLKSRLFRGSPETSLLESLPPPVPSRCSLVLKESAPSLANTRTTAGWSSRRVVIEFFAGMPRTATEIEYSPGARASKRKLPLRPVVADVCPPAVLSRIVASAIAAPVLSRNTPDHHIGSPRGHTESISDTIAATKAFPELTFSIVSRDRVLDQLFQMAISRNDKSSVRSQSMRVPGAVVGADRRKPYPR